jgi:phytoene dehydrogenase-like protein
VTTKSMAYRGRGPGHLDGGPAGRAPGFGPALIVVGALLGGCQLFGQDTARCDQSVATVRQAIGFKDFASARTWREYTWKVCDERGVVATLDKEIVDAEAAAAAEVEAAKKNAMKQAKDRINAAQKLWRAFDAETPENRNEQALEATSKSAARLESGLTPTFAQQLRKYNEGERQKRLAALKR